MAETTTKNSSTRKTPKKVEEEILDEEFTELSDPEITSEENEENEPETVIEDLVDSEEVSDEDLDDISDDLEWLMRMFEKRRTHMASKSQRRKIYKDEHMIAPESMNILSAADEKRNEGHELMLAARNESGGKMVKEGYVIGMTETDTTNDILAIVKLKGSKGHFQIKIPVEHLFVFDKEAYVKNGYSPEEIHRILRSLVQDRIGSYIRFCVYDVIEKDAVAYASRLAAMERDADRNFRAKPVNGHERYRVDDLVPARVLAVMKDRVIVECMGAEAVIKSGRDLSWTALRDCRNEFKIDEQFRVRITNIVKTVPYEVLGKKFNLTYLEVSKTAAEQKPNELYYDQFKIGDIVGGEIKYEANESGFFVTLQEKMDCLCSIPSFGSYHAGDKVLVKIVKKDDETKRVKGIIVR